MFSVLKSDSSDENNKTTEKREISNENTISMFKRNRTDDENGNIADNEGFSDPVGKRQRINRSDTLASKKKKLFRKVCSGRDENFKIEMTKKNPLYIEDLSDEIDEYVDELVMTNYSTFIDLLGFDVSELRRDITCTYIMKNQCKLEGDKNNEEGCTRIPGYYEHENVKKFIPQLYHILQDYGFFYHYLEFPMMDKKLKQWEILSRWSFKLGRIVQKRGTPQNKYRFITIILLRLRRVQFLRAFDVKCCLEKIPDEDHLTFDKVLETVYDTLLVERSDIMKNNPHLTF